MEVLDKVLPILQVVMYVVGAAAVFAASIAKLTKTEKDDKVAAALRYIHDLLAKLGLQPSIQEKQLIQAAKVVDHRSAK